jgi:hypothetical protein
MAMGNVQKKKKKKKKKTSRKYRSDPNRSRQLRSFGAQILFVIHKRNSTEKKPNQSLHMTTNQWRTGQRQRTNKQTNKTNQGRRVRDACRPSMSASADLAARLPPVRHTKHQQKNAKSNR